MSKVEKFYDKITKKSMDYYVDDDNTIWFNAEEIARGLGFVLKENKVSSTSGRKHYSTVKWQRVNQYLKEFGYNKEITRGDYIPEQYVNLLAMKAKSDTAKEFQRWLAFDVIPSIRKHGIYIDKDHDKIRSFGINVRLVEARAIKHLLVYAKENYNIELNRDENYGKLSCYANRISDMKQDARDEADSINLAICLTIESCIAVTINTLISLNIHPLDITKMTMHTLNKFVAKIREESKKRKAKKNYKISLAEVSNSIVKNYSKLAKKHIFNVIETL